MRMQQQIFYSFLLIIAIPTVVFFGIVISIFAKSIEDRTISAGELVVKESVKRIDTLLNDYRRASMQIYYNDEVMDRLSEASTGDADNDSGNQGIREILKSIVNADKYLMTAVLRTEDIIIVEGNAFLGLVEYMDSQTMMVNSFPGRLAWIPSRELDSIFGLDSLYFGAMRLIRRDNQEVGQLLFLVREDFFDDIYAGAIPHRSGSDLVLSPEGIVISSSDKLHIGRIIEDDEILEIVSGTFGKNGYRLVKRADGKNYLIFAQSDESGWYYVREMKEEEIFSDIANLKQSIIIIIALYVLFQVFLSVFISRSLGRPIHELTGSIDKMGLDTLDIPAVHSRLKVDEISSLEYSLLEMSNRIRSLIDDVSREEKARTEAELKALRNHISPHFIYNALDTIRWMAVINKQDNIREMVSALDKLLRYAANSDTILISLSEEMDIIKEYVLIQNMRYPDIVLQNNISDRIGDLKVNKFIIQTLVENSIVHGFRNLERTGVIEISAIDKTEYLELTVTDNGCGFDVHDKHDPDRSHTGLQSINQRLSLNYGSEYGVSIVSKSGEGAKAVLRLPLIN